MNWNSFNTAFVISTVLGVAVAAAGGRYLPSDDGRSIPLVTANIMRTERIWQAHTGQPEACIAFLGDSRTAFQLNSSEFSMPDCKASNYAFPGLFAKTVGSVAQAIGRPKLIVFTYSESIFQQRPETWKDHLLSWRIPRSVYLSFARTTAAVSAVFSDKRKPSDGWWWNPALGRWIYDGVDKRQLASLPSRDSEIHTMAVSYFVKVKRPPTLEEDVKAFLMSLATRTERLVVAIPPSMPGYRDVADSVAPGEHAAYLDAARSAAKSLGLPVLDCAVASTCGLDVSDFADPVHMNDKGAAKWTAVVKERLRIQALIPTKAAALPAR
ncbi:hypothetical protein ASE66_25475 [Bosea sp. Root483D1]|nr:hypothetical protein ASE66_25475 [Bosea sp. Root483D1]